jgi:carbon monoxide dehydrogenase subunit G
MISFDGTETFPLPLADTLAKLGDAGFLAGCLPDTEVIRATPDEAEWKSRPQLSFLSGAIDTTAKVTERTGTTLKYALTTKAVGSGSTVEATLALEPTDGGTLVRWSGAITGFSGLLKLAPKGLIQATATKVIADIWLAVRAKLAPAG